jgi:hypothetical protein
MIARSAEAVPGAGGLTSETERSRA